MVTGMDVIHHGHVVAYAADRMIHEVGPSGCCTRHHEVTPTVTIYRDDWLRSIGFRSLREPRLRLVVIHAKHILAPHALDQPGLLQHSDRGVVQ